MGNTPDTINRIVERGNIIFTLTVTRLSYIHYTTRVVLFIQVIIYIYIYIILILNKNTIFL